MAYNLGMSRNPFKPTTDQTTEFGWGAGGFPLATLDYSQGGYRSRIPLADPDRSAQIRDLRAARRTDLNNPNEFLPPAFFGNNGSHPLHYALGNTERYGAQPPIVRETKTPPYCPPKRPPRPRMAREF